MGIDVDRIFALSYGIGMASLGAAACLLMPIFYVSPQVGNVFVLVAFTVVVLGGMGSFPGAVVGGLMVGMTENSRRPLSGREPRADRHVADLHPVLLLRPTGLFGSVR